jgi:Domain of unknown function (DUF4352)
VVIALIACGLIFIAYIGTKLKAVFKQNMEADKAMLSQVQNEIKLRDKYHEHLERSTEQSAHLEKLEKYFRNEAERAPNSSNGSARNVVLVSIGDVMRSENLEVVINSVETPKKVGGELFESKASEGGIYLAVRWSYKNISSKPISILDHPEIHLVAPDGTQYNEDLGATTAYASQFDVDEKILSDLNPGIKVNTATVFEVSQAMLGDQKGWTLAIGDDSKMKVSLK